MSDKQLLGKRELAKVLNVAPGYIDDLVEAGMPIARPKTRQGTANLFDADVCTDWYSDLLNAPPPDMGLSDIPFQEGARRKIVAEALIKEHEYERLQGKYLDVDLVIDSFSRVLGLMTSKLKSIPYKTARGVCASMMVPEKELEVRLLLEDHINEVIKELHHFNPTELDQGEE